MPCADESLGRSSSTLSDNFAAERSLPSAINGCSRCAAVNFCVATASFSSLAAIVGTCGSVVFTVARCAHPQRTNPLNAKIDNFILRLPVRFVRAVSRSLPLISTVTLTASPDMSLTPFAPFGPDVLEDESRDDKTEENSNHAVADVIEIGIGRIALKDAVEESECDLQPGVADPFASSRDPARDASGTSNKDDERCDRFHVRHEKDDGEKRERSADEATDDSQSAFVKRRLSALQRDECAGNERRVDSRPIDRLINDEAEHRGKSDFEGEMHVRRISECVRHK